MKGPLKQMTAITRLCRPLGQNWGPNPYVTWQNSIKYGVLRTEYQNTNHIQSLGFPGICLRTESYVGRLKHCLTLS